MGFLDRFKKEEKKPISEKPEKKIEEKKVEEKPEKPEKKEIKPKAKKARTGKQAIGAYSVLKEPHITEKATFLEKENKYVFKVYPRSNKIEIKKAVEGLYGVSVSEVNIINVSPKKRRLGRTEGWKKGYKKAIVKLKEGQKIELLPR